MSGSALVLLSGGLDSAVALAWAHQKFEQVQAITFQYYLRPFRERLSVLRLLQKFPSRLWEVPLPFLKEAGDFHAELTAKAPEGYVSNRNIIFYSIAVHYAELQECSIIIGGHTAEDQEAFPDAGSVFLHHLQDLTNQALQLHKIRIELPLSSFTKLQVLQKAVEWRVPLEYTWSCYSDGMEPCGKCISCTERRAAFRELGINDPLCTT
jgi:7-cyano-7-deazaguanine synthase